MVSQYVWIWTILAAVVTRMAFCVTQRRKMKKTAKSTANEVEEERRSETNEATDVIIVGAGVAGSALACALAKDGRRVHIIEKDLRVPDKVVGEVMQPGGYLKLIQLGLQDCLEEIDAQRVNGVTIYKDGKQSYLPYPFVDKFPSDSLGRIFYHGRFIQRLRHKATLLPNVHLEEGIVTSLIEEGEVIKGVTYKNKKGENVTAFASLTVVCDGSHSNLRRCLFNSKVDVQSYIVAFVARNCQLPGPNSMHLIMAKPTSVMLFQISSTDVRCLVEVLANGALSIANGDMSAYLAEAVAPQVPPKLHDIFMKGIEGGNMKKVPTKRMAASRCDKKGVLAIGDALNMRHPIIAAGMMVALSDVVIVRDLLRSLPSLDDSNKVSQVLSSFYSLRKPTATTANVLANALHQLLIVSDEAKETMREACFNYLSRGGVCTSGMMALIGGLNPRPLSLMRHFTAIIVSVVARLLFPFPLLHHLWLVLKVFQLAWNIMSPYIKTEGIIQMFSPTTGIGD